MVSPVMTYETDQKISVVVPMLNEEGNAAALIGEIQAAGTACPIAEIVIIDDGSADKTAAIVKGLRQNDPRIRLVSHSRRCGQSTALRTGVRAAKGPLIVTMDGDGQNNPADIPSLYQAFARNPEIPMLLVAGQRKKRMDSLLKKFTSRTGNAIRSWLLQDGVRDTGCSLKLFRRDDFLAQPFFNHMHRYIPALFQREHGTVVLVDVGHRSREQGTSKYGFWDRLWAGIFDIFGVLWLIKRGAPKVDVSEG
jgi:dolichol-phosphate mannosyltransferase